MHPEFAALLEIARQHAAAGRFADMTALCRQLTQAPVTGTGLLIEVGNLFAAQGFLMQARHCYLRARQIEPENLKILGNLANLAQSAVPALPVSGRLASTAAPAACITNCCNNGRTMP